MLIGAGYDTTSRGDDNVITAIPPETNANNDSKVTTEHVEAEGDDERSVLATAIKKAIGMPTDFRSFEEEVEIWL